MCWLFVILKYIIIENKKTQKPMLLATLSFVIIIMILAFLSGARFRLIQHRTTRKLEGRQIPGWLDFKIEFLGFPILIWRITSLVGLVLFSLRLYQIGRFELILVCLIVSTLIFYLGSWCSAKITSKIFSQKILKEFGENTTPEC